MLLAMLYKNGNLVQIEYTVTNEENKDRLERFNQYKQLTCDEIEEKLEKDHSNEDLPIWQKIVCCVWCWKSFIHDKHEAFRFKYDTKSLKLIEDELMSTMMCMLYFNSVIYYIIMFGAPMYFANECGDGL